MAYCTGISRDDTVQTV